MNENKERHLFRRRHYLIDQSFQLRYIGLFIGLASIIFMIFVLAAKYYINMNLDPLVESGMISSPALSELINIEKRFLSKNLLTIFLILISVLTICGIFITHRVAGPIFALKRQMQEITQTGFPETKLRIRQTDEFQDVVEIFNDMISSLEKRLEEKKNNEIKKAA